MTGKDRNAFWRESGGWNFGFIKVGISNHLKHPETDKIECDLSLHLPAGFPDFGMIRFPQEFQGNGKFIGGKSDFTVIREIAIAIRMPHQVCP